MTDAWLVVNADDLGVSRGTTLGVLKAHREGVVTSASLAVTTPSYQHALSTCVRACPALGIGLHVTLTSGTPAADVARIPLLVGRDGRFRWRFTSLLAAAAVRRHPALLAQVAIEVEAQFDRLLQDGIHPDHVDGERHVHLIPGVLEIVMDVAARHGVRYLRAGRDLGTRFPASGGVLRVVANGGIIKSAVLGTFTHRARRMLPDALRSPDYVASFLYTGRADAMLPALLASAPVPGITEAMVHPAVLDAEAPVDLGNRELERYVTSRDRVRELEACIAARAQPTRWTLTTYRELARREERTA